MPSGAENVNFHIEAGVTGGDTVAVGYLVCNDNTLAWCQSGLHRPNPAGGENKASWYWEWFNCLGCDPEQTFGAAGSAGVNGDNWTYQVVGSSIFPNLFDYYQTATYLGSHWASGWTINTSVLPTTAGMELFGEATTDTSVVGTSFFNALYYATSRDILTRMSQATVVYGEQNECPPYKIQGRLQNSALEAGAIKVGNNQGISTACPANGARLW